MEKIEIKYTWDKDLALKSAQDIYKYELQHSNKKYIGLLFIGMLQFGVVGALKHNAYGFLVLATIGLTYWYGLRWPIRKYFILKTFEKSPLADKTISLTIQNDGIYSEDKLQIEYKNIIKYVQLDDALVIYHTLGTIYLPSASFPTSKDIKKFIKILDKNK